MQPPPQKKYYYYCINYYYSESRGMMAFPTNICSDFDDVTSN